MYALFFCLALVRFAAAQGAQCTAWFTNQDQINCFQNTGVDVASFSSSFSADSLTADQAWGFCNCISGAPSDCGDILHVFNAFCGAGEDCVKSIINAYGPFETCINKYSSASNDTHVLARCACFDEANLQCAESLVYLGVQDYCTAVYDAVDAVVDTLSTKIIDALNQLSSSLQITIQTGSDGHDRQIVIVDPSGVGLVKIETFVQEVCAQINNWISNDCDGHAACKNIAVSCPVVKTSKRSDTYTATLGYTGSSGVAVASLLGFLSLIVLAIL